MTMKNAAARNGCQLITYADSLGGNLSALRTALDGPLGDAVVGVHLLPFYPSSGDRGFAPLTFDEVDEAFGSWADIEKLTERYDVMVDFVANHLSRRSPYFLDYLEKGSSSAYADLFLRPESLSPTGSISPQDLAKIYTRKPRAPFIEVQFADGTKQNVWCTFGEEQIDLDWRSEVTRALARQWLEGLAERGIRFLRVDAFGYAVKKLGTSCFFVEPEMWEVLGLIRDAVANAGIELLPEVHAEYQLQHAIERHGYYAYDFCLPMLVLHGLFSGDSAPLKHWLATCPRRQFTTLDTHDGLPVLDVAGLLDEAQIKATTDALFARGGNVNRRYSSAEYDNLDIYQINCTYYSALGEDDAAYLLARAIQFFTPGIPQVYYVGLLAGVNDLDKVELTRAGRDINRHDYTDHEIRDAVQRDVVQQLLALMRFRNTCSAFNGAMTILEQVTHTDFAETPAASFLGVRWAHAGSEAELYADLQSKRFVIRHRDEHTPSWQTLVPNGAR